MPWFRKQEEEPPPPSDWMPSPPHPVPGTCSVAGCPNTAVYHCCYADGRGAICDTPWCVEHIGALYPSGGVCRRHRLVTEALASTEGSILERARPHLEDRRYSLLVLLVAQLDQAMTDLLRRRFETVADTQVATDVAVRATRRGPELAWERGWSAYGPTGNLARIAFRIPESEPPVVQVLVNQAVVMDSVPPWIISRPRNEDEREREHTAFRDLVMTTIGGALRM